MDIQIDSPAPLQSGQSTPSTPLSLYVSELRDSDRITQHRLDYLETRIRSLEEGQVGTQASIESLQSAQRLLGGRLSWLEGLLRRIRQLFVAASP